MKRNVMLGVVVAAVVAAAGVGWLFGSRIRSPAEVAAEAGPPEASRITVPVVAETLSADVITRGDIVFDDPESLSLSGSFAAQPERLVVTRSVEVGDELAEGDVVVEVVGRPVFLLSGEIPVYRDLRPGASGDDVLQLEEALVRMGFLTGTPGDTWDDDTGAAVSAWYDEAGYRPNGLSAEDELALRAARDRVRNAQTALADAEAALSQAGSESGQAALAAARAEIAAAEDGLELAELDADRANNQAARAESDADDALAEARGDLASAEEALRQARESDPRPPKQEMDTLRQAVADAKAAEAEAEAVLEQAQFDKGRTATEQSALVDAARSRVTVAKAALADLQRVDTGPLQRQVSAAGTELGEARDELTDLESGLGTWLPAGELVYVGRLPVRVDQVAVSRGSIIEGAFVTVSGSELALRSSVPERDAPRVEVGMAVEIENPDTGDIIAGTVSDKAERAGTDNVPPDRVAIEITPEELPESIIGANVRVVIPVSSTGGDVLAVPAAALSATADGSTILQVEDEDGTLRTVPVETGLAAGGLVEVSPLDGELSEGDQVVVGTEDGETPPDDGASP